VRGSTDLGAYPLAKHVGVAVGAAARVVGVGPVIAAVQVGLHRDASRTHRGRFLSTEGHYDDDDTTPTHHRTTRGLKTEEKHDDDDPDKVQLAGGGNEMV
jgi:hypothetical protein